MVETMCRLDFFVAGRKVSIYTDHANLIYLYDPLRQKPGPSRHNECKLMRWALKLSGFKYVIEHVAGDTNVCAEIYTRWAVDRKMKARMSITKSLIVSPINVSTEQEFEWPKKGDLVTSKNLKTNGNLLQIWLKLYVNLSKST